MYKGNIYYEDSIYIPTSGLYIVCLRHNLTYILYADVCCGRDQDVEFLSAIAASVSMITGTH